MGNFEALYGLDEFAGLVDGKKLVRFNDLTQEQAKAAPSIPMLGYVKFDKSVCGRDIALARIPENPIVAISGGGRRALEQAAMDRDYFALVSGACAFIIKNDYEKPALVLTWRDGGAPSFKYHLHICGGISGWNARGLDFELLHPGYVAFQEGKQEILWCSRLGIFDPQLLGHDFDAQDNNLITDHAIELVSRKGLINADTNIHVPLDRISLSAQFIREKQEGVFIVDWENRQTTLTKAHMLVSARSKNIDIAKIAVLNFGDADWSDLHPFYTEEFKGDALATPLYLLELNDDYTCTGNMVGMYDKGILTRFNIPAWNFQMTDPLIRTLDILGPSDMVRRSVPEDIARKLFKIE